MKLFGISEDNEFKEYIKTAFQMQFEEAVLEDWLEKNPHSILEDGALLLIGRQVKTNLNSIIDLLGVDRQGSLVVVELKRNRTPRETLAQALEYASFTALLDYEQIEKILQSYLSDEGANLAEYHREYFHLGNGEAPALNKEQRIIIIGQTITPEIHQTATFLRQRGLRVTCIEFGLFETEDGRRLLSSDITVGEEASMPIQVISGSLPKIDEHKFMESLDEFGRPVFTRLLALAHKKGYAIHWGTRGFSVNVIHQGVHVVNYFGYPPISSAGQSLKTSFYWQGGLNSKLNIPEAELRALYDRVQQTGLFTQNGQELKCRINRSLSAAEIDMLVELFEEIARAIVRYPLKIESE